MSDKDLFEMNGTLAVEVLDALIAKIKSGELTIEEANKIGSRMPKGFEIEFQNVKDD
mgnify:CR=1 FL=1